MTLFVVPLVSPRCVNKCSKIVQFEIPISVYPEQQTYNVNDTLWVELELTPFLEDKISLDQLNVGYHNFQVKMDILELIDSSWVDGTYNVRIVPSIGEVEIIGQTYPEIVPHFIKIENDTIQKWKFGMVLVEGNKDLVLLFGKRDPRGWSGEYFFPESDCIYGISSSYFLTNEGNIDYQYYVQKYPFFNETGLSGNQADNHRDYGAYFFSVE